MIFLFKLTYTCIKRETLLHIIYQNRTSKAATPPEVKSYPQTTCSQKAREKTLLGSTDCCEVYCKAREHSTKMVGELKWIKIFLILFNLLFWASGIALIVIGSTSCAKYYAYESFTGDSLTHIAALLIVVGVIITIISFLGCCGTWSENQCLLITFTAFLAVILIIEIAAGITFYVLHPKIEKLITTQSTKIIDEYSSKMQNSINDIQSKFHCCGGKNYTDWFYSHIWGKNSSVPDSCCKKPKTGCGSNTSSENIYQQGCLEKIKTLLKENMVWIGAAAVGLGVVQISGVMFAFLMLRDIKREYDEM
ncbi:CD63 antigen-like [Latimeria chalumnae]|uniref:CD63 antigen-like n=1 Tax=Latimeria chalumnae TaxID=7897 RepID=UPI00313D0E8C